MKFINNHTPFLHLLLAIVVLASCATPKAVIRMNPVSENVRWNYGQAFASDTVLGIVVEAAFDNTTNEYAIFDVSIINNSNMDYLVDPVLFRIEKIISEVEHNTELKAIDPESVLLNIDKQLSQNEADIKNAKVGGAIVAGAILATSVAIAVSDVGDVHRHHREVDPNLIIAAPILLDDSANYDTKDYVSSIERKREMWASSTIRKTTLQPGYKIEGKVFFPKFVSPGFYNLNIPVDDETISIQFVQLNFFPQ